MAALLKKVPAVQRPPRMVAGRAAQAVGQMGATAGKVEGGERDVHCHPRGAMVPDTIGVAVSNVYPKTR